MLRSIFAGAPKLALALGLERQSLLWQRICQGFALMSKQALTLHRYPA